MVDTLVLGTSGESRVGSSPTLGTNKNLKINFVIQDFFVSLYCD